MKKLRLIITEDCNRSCPGCCNNDFNIQALPLCTSFENYDTIMLTGGEPMLYQNRIQYLIEIIRKQNPTCKIIMYTAKTKRQSDLAGILTLLDGITITLHEQYDVEPFKVFDELIDCSKFKQKSLRLNVFKNVNINGMILNNIWTIKPNIEWIKDCPLPENEVLMRV